MLKHLPFGLGHPYRTEPFERTPHFPTIEDSITLRAIAPLQTSEVRLEISTGEEIVLLPMKKSGPAQSTELGPFGITEKEIVNDTHLQDAAARSGEYQEFDCWTYTLSPGDYPNGFNYRFLSENEASDFYECPVYSWKNTSHFQLISNDKDQRLSNQLVLVGKNGDAKKIRFDVAIEEDEKVVGFGERFNTILQENQLVDAVVYEEYKGQGARTYMPVPFFHALTSGFALHVATTTRSYFDVKQVSGQITIEVDLVPNQESLQLEFFYGNPAENLAAYLRSVGKPGEVPDWVFSLWISSNEWNTQKRVLAEVEACVKSGIKPGVVVIEAWSDESTFTVFRDAEYKVTNGIEGLKARDISYPTDGAWPNPQEMIDYLHEKDIRLILWQIPVIKEIGTPGSQAEVNWNTAIENEYVVRDENGDPYRVRGFWFQGGLLPDLTDRQVREWWADQRRYLVEELGVDGFKTDGGEHAWGNHLIYRDRKLGIEKNNTFPVHYAQAFHELLESLGKDPVTFSRAGFTGSQAFPTFWAGDENSTWPAFRASIRAGITASASGFFHWGWDIGGFSGDIPTPELYLRGTAMATFCPIMQIHSEYNHHRTPSNDRTPWNLANRHQDPELLSVFARFGNIREQLIPYLQKSSAYAIQSGRPIMAGLFFDYLDDHEIWNFPYQYMLGRELLICPVTEPGTLEVEVYLPRGQWFDFWTGVEISGGQRHSVESPLDTIPVFSKDANLTWPLINNA